jgi:hypothetical protein
MSIMPFLNGRQFDPEALRILGLAFEQVCIALQVETSDDDVKQAIANKVIEFAAVLIYYASGFWRTSAGSRRKFKALNRPNLRNASRSRPGGAKPSPPR